jgi:hypothetical protein
MFVWFRLMAVSFRTNYLYFCLWLLQNQPSASTSQQFAAPPMLQRRGSVDAMAASLTAYQMTSAKSQLPTDTV